MASTLLRSHVSGKNGIDRLRKLPLEPLEYCDRWVYKFTGIAPGERGYRAACIRELAKATGLKEQSIDNNWAKDFTNRPDWVLVPLRNADLVNQARELFSNGEFHS